MIKILISALIYVLTSFIAKLIASFALGWIVFEGLDTLVELLLDNAVKHLSGLPTVTVQVLRLAGVFDALSLYGSALMTAAAIRALRAFITRLV